MHKAASAKDSSTAGRYDGWHHDTSSCDRCRAHRHTNRGNAGLRGAGWPWRLANSVCSAAENHRQAAAGAKHPAIVVLGREDESSARTRHVKISASSSQPFSVSNLESQAAQRHAAIGLELKRRPRASSPMRTNCDRHFAAPSTLLLPAARREQDLEKWKPVFRKDRALLRKLDQRNKL